MTWREIEIGELGKIVTGKTPPTANREMYDGDYMFVTPTDLDWQSYYVRNTHSTVTQLAREKLKNQFIPANSTVFTCIGNTIGKCGLTSEDCLSNQQINSVIPSEQHDPRFVYYLLNFNRPKIRSIGLSGGAAQPIINKTTFSSVKVSVPETKAEEEAISEALSAYDDLIENNRRRISLLEEAARLLYREWFVHFRFPGHEHVKIVDGVPEGWLPKTIGEHCPLVYGKALKADSRVPGECDVFGSSGIVGSHNKKLVSGPAIVVGRKGNVGSIFWARKDFWPIDTVYYVAPENCDFFTYYALQHVTFINTDVAVPGLNRDFAHSRKLLMPTEALLETFHSHVEPIQAQIGLLERQSAELAKARDLLLPRLMDGRLEVAA